MAASKKKTRESKLNQREIFDNIKSKAKEAIQNRKKVNYVIDLQSYLEASWTLI